MPDEGLSRMLIVGNVGLFWGDPLLKMENNRFMESPQNIIITIFLDAKKLPVVVKNESS